MDDSAAPGGGAAAAARSPPAARDAGGRPTPSLARNSVRSIHTLGLSRAAASFASTAATPKMLYDSDDDGQVTAKWHCDLVRKKISEFIATKAMTQSAFQRLAFRRRRTTRW